MPMELEVEKLRETSWLLMLPASSYNYSVAQHSKRHWLLDRHSHVCLRCCCDRANSSTMTQQSAHQQLICVNCAVAERQRSILYISWPFAEKTEGPVWRQWATKCTVMMWSLFSGWKRERIAVFLSIYVVSKYFIIYYFLQLFYTEFRESAPII